MFGEASSLASYVLKRLLDLKYTEATLEDFELNDMLESAGMVLVQSLKELGRYPLIPYLNFSFHKFATTLYSL